LSLELGICVCWVEPLVVLNVDKYSVLFCCLEEFLLVLESLDCWLGDEDVDLALDGIEGDWVMSGIGCEDGDSVTWGESIDCLLVCLCVSLVVRWEGLEGGIEVVVDVCDVLCKMLACDSSMLEWRH
jgi:hypothetical protein